MDERGNIIFISPAICKYTKSPETLLGGIDGLEIYQKILRLFPKQRAIITSGYSKSGRVAAMQDLGAGIFVQKPFTLEQLGMAVKTSLSTPTETAALPASRRP